MALTLTTPSAVAPVVIEQLQAHLKVDAGEDDVYIQHCLDTAIAQFDGADGELGRALVNQTWRETYASVPGGGGAVELSLSPVSSVTKVEVRGADGVWSEVTLSTVQLFEDGGRFYVETDTWPRPGTERNPFRIEYVAGYGAAASAVPAQIQHAILLLAAHLYEVREPIVFGTIQVEVPFSIARLVSAFKIWWQ